MNRVFGILFLLVFAMGGVFFACSNDKTPGGNQGGTECGDECAPPEASSDSADKGGNSSNSSGGNSSPAAVSSSSRAASSASNTPSSSSSPAGTSSAAASSSSRAASSSAAAQSPCVQPQNSVPPGGITSCIIVNGKCYTCNPERGNDCNQPWIWNGGNAAGDTYWYKEVDCKGSTGPTPGVSSSAGTVTSSNSGGGTSSNSGSGNANTGTPVNNGKNGTGWASRYWDGCKPSCAWTGNAGGNPTKSCGNDGVTKLNADARNYCNDGGDSHTCYSQVPWAVNDNVAYGFAASHTNSDCGKCFRLTFKASSQHVANTNALNHIKGKIMVVKISNIGGDVQGTQFDLMIPGGGLGAFDGFTMQTGVNGSVLKSSERYGGFVSDCGGGNQGNGALSTLQTCVKDKCNSAFTNADLKAGCNFYAEWAGAANNPQFDFVEVTCPTELNSKW